MVPSTPCSTTYLDFRVCGQTRESSLPLPKHHSQTAQDLVKKSTLNHGTGGQMKRLFLGTVALVALGLGTPAAFAAELRRPPPPPPPAYAPPPPPAYTWTGCYVGASAGSSYGT